MDEEFPSIELKLKFQDVDKTMYLFLYLLTFFIISCTFYLYLLIFKKIYNLYLNVMYLTDDEPIGSARYLNEPSRYLDEPVRYSDIENNNLY